MKNTIIIILSLLVIALGGFLIYDKFLSKNKTITNNTSSNNNFENEKCEECNLDKLSSITKVGFTSKYAYFYYDKAKNNLDINFYTENVKDNSNVLVKSKDQNENDIYKLSLEKTVRNFGFFDVGQGNMYDLVIVNDDGTVDILSLNIYEDANNKVLEIEILGFKNAEGRKNVVAVFESDDFESMSGNNSYDYIYFNK